MDSTKPRLAFRVGITGKRTISAGDADRIRGKIAATLGEIQATLQDQLATAPDDYAPEPPLLFAVSSLAEGADRIFAEEALKLGCELQAALPYQRDEYEKDFSDPDARRVFRELLGQAAAIFEVEGETAENGDHLGLAYETSGRIVLDHSDLLIAVWDGNPAQGRGGTAQVVELARARGLPVVCLGVDGFGDFFFGKLAHEEGLPLAPELYRQQIVNAVRPPWWGIADSRKIAEAKGAYTSGEAAGSPLGLLWKAFVAIARAGARMPKSCREQIPDSFFRPLYQHMDAVASRLVGLYRGTFVLNYSLGVAAVFFALLRFVHEERSPEAFGWAELFAIVAVLLLIATLQHYRWHHRSVDCRYLAEQFRVLCYLYPLGMTAPPVRVSAHNWQNDLQQTWMEWRLRTILRGHPMPTRYLTRDNAVNYYRDVVENLIQNQLVYHERNEKTLDTIAERLHFLVWIFFGAAAIACAVHFADPPGLSRWLTLCAAGFPAAAAACHAIATQGEFHRLAERSAAMKRGLQSVDDRLRAAATARSLTPGTLRRECENIAALLMEEVFDWQILYRKPVTPG
jgi:hypothetical protein